MSYLVYCIFLEDRYPRMDDPPVGVAGSQTYVVADNQLAAAVSALHHSEIPQDYSAILTYHNVIQSFHDQLDVVPLRFGTVFNEEEEVTRLLAKHGERYKKLLEELDGCVEMGIRVISDDMRLAADSCNKEYILSPPTAPGTGAAYLAERKALYDAEALATKMEQEAIEQYRIPFDGIFVRFKGETSRRPVLGAQSRTTLLSLDFLLPRQSEESFRKVYKNLKSGKNARMMLSGPWPPYSFVLPEDCQSRNQDD